MNHLLPYLVGVPVGFFIGFYFLNIPAIYTWLRFRRVCAWCQPPRRIGGNPFAHKITHGMCPKCQTRTEREAEFLNHHSPTPTLHSPTP